MDLDHCELACDRSGDPGTCVRFADKQRARPGATQHDRAAARDRYRALCERTRDALACTRGALIGGLSVDYELAPDWLVPGGAPLAALVAACAAGERGRLACAALELLGAEPALAVGPRSALCQRGPGEDPRACAAAIALAACRDDGDAEACQLAAASELATARDARERLDALCDQNHRPACLYLWARSGAADRLLNACPDARPAAHDDGVAAACLARSQGPRGQSLRDRACELGSCQGPAVSPAVIAHACRDGHQLNACAAEILANRTARARWEPIFAAHRARVPEPVRPASPGAVTGEQAACYLGSIDGCRLAIARLATRRPADRALAHQLADFAAVLRHPLAVR